MKKIMKKNKMVNNSKVMAYASEGTSNRNCRFSCTVVNINKLGGCITQNSIC